MAISVAVFIVVVSVLGGCILILFVSTLIFYLKVRSLAKSQTPRPAVPQLFGTYLDSSLRPPNHHLATSDAYSSLRHLPLHHSSRPPSFLRIDPAATLNDQDSPPRSRPSPTNRLSIATTISRNGSRVFTRNPSPQDSHDTKRSLVADRSQVEQRGGKEIVIERTRRKRKNYGVGNDENSFEVERDGFRKRSSTWTTEDLGYLVDQTDLFSPAGFDNGAAKRSSLPARRLSLNLRHVTSQPSPILTPAHHNSFANPLRDDRDSSRWRIRQPEFNPSSNIIQTLPGESWSPHSHAHLPSHSAVDMTHYHLPSAAPRDFSSSFKVLPYSSHSSPPPHQRSHTLPPHLSDPRFSTSSQALFDLELYAAGLSQPPTPSFTPRPLSLATRPNSNLLLSNPVSSAIGYDAENQEQGLDEGGAGSQANAQKALSPTHRPLSWMKRQGSSGTLPERVFDDSRLAIANPDESRTSSSTYRNSLD